MQLHNNTNIHEISLTTLKKPHDDAQSANFGTEIRPKNTFRINSSFILNDNQNNVTNDDDIRMKALLHIDSYLTSKGVSPIGTPLKNNIYDTPNINNKRYWSMNIDKDNYRLYSDKKKLLFRMNETEHEEINQELPEIDVNIHLD